MLFGATVVASPAVRIAVSKASGIASLYVLNLADLRHAPAELLARDLPASAAISTASSPWSVNDSSPVSVAGGIHSRGIRRGGGSSDVVR